MSAASENSFGSKATLEVGRESYDYFRIDALDGVARLPFSLKVLLENLLRTEDGANVTAEQIQALADWRADAEPDTEIQFSPGAGRDAGLHRRAGGGRPGDDARGDASISAATPRGSIRWRRPNWSSTTP